MNFKKLLGQIYKIFLKGKTIKIGGGSITLPEQGHGINPITSDLNKPGKLPNKPF